MVEHDRVADICGIKIDMADPVGAGDAFTAALIYAILCHWPLEAAAEFSNRVAATVASQDGAMPELRAKYDEIKSRLGE